MIQTNQVVILRGRAPGNDELDLGTLWYTTLFQRQFEIYGSDQNLENR
jgi:hypothetical protein